MQTIEPTSNGTETYMLAQETDLAQEMKFAPGNEHLTELAHEARNMVTALGLYCDLLDEPGVLTVSYRHYSKDLKLVAAASRHLVEKIAALESDRAKSVNLVADTEMANRGIVQTVPTKSEAHLAQYWNHVPVTQVRDLAWELQSNRNLLEALAGPAIQVAIECHGGDQGVKVTSEELTRILVNLTKNAAEAMPTGGKLHLTLRERPVGLNEESWLVLNVEDNGTGFSTDALGKIFDAGYSTRMDTSNSGWHGEHRGLGLSITRSIVEAAGGQIHAANRDPLGACIQIELPVHGAQRDADLNLS
jgi:signal transduction histidine kinase